MVKNCTFYNNSADIFFKRPYQGNSGGLSIGYNDRVATVLLDEINITIIDSNFTKNHAAEQFSQNNVQEERIFSGRGGGIIFLINITGVDQTLMCTMRSSVFVDNFATNLGGGTYTFTSETSNLNQTYVVANNIFAENTAGYGGGYYFASNEVDSGDYSQNRFMYNCSFIDNKALHIGGGMYIYSTYGLGADVIMVEGCSFSRNTAVDHGGAFDAVSYNLYGNRELQSPVKFVNW